MFILCLSSHWLLHRLNLKKDSNWFCKTIDFTQRLEVLQHDNDCTTFTKCSSLLETFACACLWVWGCVCVCVWSDNMHCYDQHCTHTHTHTHTAHTKHETNTRKNETRGGGTTRKLKWKSHLKDRQENKKSLSRQSERRADKRRGRKGRGRRRRRKGGKGRSRSSPLRDFLAIPPPGESLDSLPTRRPLS